MNPLGVVRVYLYALIAMLAGVHSASMRDLRGAPVNASCSSGNRVRSSNPYILAMTEEASRRSPTFRGLLTAIDATDGIVYIEQGNCMHKARACLALDVASAAGCRILRVGVDARRPDWDVMASIGHELRHAIEVLENRSLNDQSSVYLFYAQGRQAPDRPFETDAAIGAGDAVRKELNSFARRDVR